MNGRNKRRLVIWNAAAIVLIAAAVLAWSVGQPKLSGAQAGASKLPAGLIRVATYNVRGPNDRSPNSWRDRLPRMVRTARPAPSLHRCNAGRDPFRLPPR